MMLRLIFPISSLKGKIKDTVEVGEDIFVEYGENDEIWQARKSIIPSIIEYIEKGKVVGV